MVDCDMGVYKRDDHEYDHNDAIYDMLAPRQRCDPLAKIGFFDCDSLQKLSNRMTHTTVAIGGRGD